MRKPPFYIMLSLMTIAIFLAIMGFFSLNGSRLFFDLGIFSPAFNLGRESSIPTWYNAIVLFVLAILTAIVTLGELADDRPFVRRWGWLALIFMIMSVEEIAAIREFVLNARLRDLFNASGIFYYAWVIPGIALVILFFVAYFTFMLKLPRFVRLMFVIGAVVYVGGALGLELLESFSHNVLEPGLLRVRISQITGIAEESSEIIGVVLLIYAVLVYLWEHSIYREYGMSIFKRDFLQRIWQYFRIDIAIITIAIIAFFVGLGSSNRPEYVSLARTHMGVGLPMDAPPEREPILFGEEMPFWGAKYSYISEWNLVEVQLWWWTEQPMSADYSIGVYVLDSNGQTIAQHDGAINDLYYGEIQTSRMEPQRIYLDERLIDLPSDVQAGTYSVHLAVYQWWDGVRLLLPDGSDALYLGDISIE